MKALFVIAFMLTHAQISFAQKNSLPSFGRIPYKVDAAKIYDADVIPAGDRVYFHVIYRPIVCAPVMVVNELCSNAYLTEDGKEASSNLNGLKCQMETFEVKIITENDIFIFDDQPAIEKWIASYKVKYKTKGNERIRVGADYVTHKDCIIYDLE